MSYIDKVPIWREMKAVGMGTPPILIFSTLGLGLWGVFTLDVFSKIDRFR